MLDRYRPLLQTVVTLLESRNPYNIEHCRLVAHYSDAVARVAGLETAARERLKAAAELHTLGVLLQMEEKRAHQTLPITKLGLRSGREQPMHRREEQILQAVLGGVDGLDECIPIVVQRHEWFDGTGSLLGKQGESILPEARALAVADAFVDLATPKSHRDPITLPEVMSRIQSQSGKQFDPRYVAALAALLKEEEERWGATARARQFEAARYRHWLGLGNFHRQCAEPDWALRCYRAALQIAERTKDIEQQIHAIFGMVMVYFDLEDYDRARDTLNGIRPALGDTQGKPRQWFMLLWGLLEWRTGQDANGEQILEGVVSAFEAEADVAGMAAAMAQLCSQLLFTRGAEDAGHLRHLQQFMDLVAQHDLFDVVVQFRPQTIPMLLSAILHRIEGPMARGILTRMGEPVHEELLRQLSDLPPGSWMASLRPKTAGAAPHVHRRRTDLPRVESGPALRVLCLGTFVVEAAGRRIVEEDWPTQKAMRLFALLAFRRQAAFTDEALMEMFWPERDETKARSSLRNAIHQIRRLLADLLPSANAGEILFRSRRTGTVSVHVDYGLDAEAFEQGVAQAASHLADGRSRDALAASEQALSLFRGDFLENVRDEWTEGPRTSLAETHLRGLQIQAQCHLAQNDPEAAEVVARRALARDDLREPLHVTLIEALLAQGRKSDALRHYHDAASHFKKEIGLSTPAALSALYDRLIR